MTSCFLAAGRWQSWRGAADGTGHVMCSWCLGRTESESRLPATDNSRDERNFPRILDGFYSKQVGGLSNNSSNPLPTYCMQLTAVRFILCGAITTCYPHILKVFFSVAVAAVHFPFLLHEDRLV